MFVSICVESIAWSEVFVHWFPFSARSMRLWYFRKPIWWCRPWVWSPWLKEQRKYQQHLQSLSCTWPSWALTLLDWQWKRANIASNLDCPQDHAQLLVFWFYAQRHVQFPPKGGASGSEWLGSSLDECSGQVLATGGACWTRGRGRNAWQSVCILRSGASSWDQVLPRALSFWRLPVQYCTTEFLWIFEIHLKYILYIKWSRGCAPGHDFNALCFFLASYNIWGLDAFRPYAASIGSDLWFTTSFDAVQSKIFWGVDWDTWL